MFCRSVFQCDIEIKNEMRTGLQMGECLTSCVFPSRVELRGCSRYGRDVRTHRQRLTCLQTDGNYSIKLPEFDKFHGSFVRNLSLSPDRR